MVAAFAAHGISKRVLFEEYLMIEVPHILEEWRKRDEMLALGGMPMFGHAPVAGEPRQEEFDEAAFEALRFATGGTG